MNVPDFFCLNPEYSTTRVVTKEQPRIANGPFSKVQTQLLLPAHPLRQGEGGLRTKGYFKESLDEKPLVSVITVVLNGREYVERTIQSVLNQSYDNVEYIVVDGGSTDGTLDVIRKYERAIDYWVSEPDKGAYDAMNKGIDLATGGSIGILNSDDWYESNAISTVLAAVKERIECVAHGNMNIYKANGLFFTARYCGAIHKLKKGMIINHPTVFVGKSLYAKWGHFNTKFKIASDWDLMLRFWKTGASFVFVPETIANFRIGGLSYNVDSDSVTERHAVRKSNGVYKIVDFYWLYDLIKLFVFGKYSSKTSILRQEFRSR